MEKANDDLRTQMDKDQNLQVQELEIKYKALKEKFSMSQNNKLDREELYLLTEKSSDKKLESISETE